MRKTGTKKPEERICELFDAGKSYEEVAEAVSTPDRPLIAYIGLVLREQQGKKK